MSDSKPSQYAELDHPEILSLLFHPRHEWGVPRKDPKAHPLSIPVADGVSLGATLHHADQSAPVILYFHGNGEIVSDYDDLGPLYTRTGVNFLPVDYRGYGRSTGTPTVTGMMSDCHRIFDYVKQRFKQTGYSGPIFVMGRSLGSASALELAAHYENQIAGLIIESGFAYVIPLLRLIGVDTERLKISEADGLDQIEKIRGFQKPTLIIHAENDRIIPLTEGQALYNACGSDDKVFLKIPGADHNTIFSVGMELYIAAIERLVKKTI